METKIIFEENPRPGIYKEEKVRSILKADKLHKCQLFHLHNPRREHYIWAISDTKYLKMKSLFDYDYIPENPNDFQIEMLLPDTFFYHQCKLYYLSKNENGCLEVGEVAVYNTWKEISTVAAAIGMSDAHLQIARSYLIKDRDPQARHFIGYCWRATTDTLMATLPLFKDDFYQIRLYDFNELDFEWMEKGEKIIHDGQFWQICQDEEKHFYTIPFTPFRI